MPSENDRSQSCCDGCRYVLTVNVRLKTHPDNESAEGVPTAGQSITDLLEYWEDVLHGLSHGGKSAFLKQKVYAFSPDGKQDRVTSDSRCVFLAKVVRACDLVGVKKCISWCEYLTPQSLHDNLGIMDDYTLKANEAVTFAFHLKKTI